MPSGSGTRLDTLYWELQVRMVREEAERQALAAGQASGEAFDKGFDAAGKGKVSADAWVQSLANDLRARRADILREASAGLITADEAAKAGKQAAAQYVKELRGGLNALREQGIISNKDFPSLLAIGAKPITEQRQELDRLAATLTRTSSIYDNLSRSVYAQAYAQDAAFNKAKGAGSIYDTLSRAIYVEAYAMDASRGSHEKHSSAVEHSIPGLGRLTNTLEGVFHKATETNPVIAKLGTTLLEFASGGLVTAAVVGGLALIATIVNKLGAEAEAATKKVDAMFEKLAKAREEARQNSIEGLKDSQLQADDRIIAARKALAEAKLGTPIFDPDRPRGEAPQRAVDLKAVARAQDELNKATANATDIQQKLNELEESTTEKRAGFLAQLIATGRATKEQAEQAKSLAASTKLQLDLLNAKTPEGAARRAEIQAAAPNDPNAVIAEQARLNGILETIDKADAKLDHLGDKALRVQQAQDSVRESFAQAIAARTTAKSDDFESLVDRLVEQAKKAKLGGDEIRTLVAELRKANADSISEKIGHELSQQAVAATVTAVDDLRLSLSQLQKTMRDQGATQAQIDQITALQQPLIDATDRSEKLAKSLARVQRDINEGVSLKTDLADIEKQIDDAIQRRNTAQAVAILSRRNAAPQTAAEAKDEADLNELLKIQAQLREKIEKLHQDALRHAHDIAGKTATFAGDVANAANAAFGLASAFLGVDSAITKSLGSIGQLAGGIGDVAKLAHEAKGFGNLFSSTSGVISALPGIGQAIGGGIALASTLFGKSPEERERLERLKENNAALAHLSQRIGDLGKNITGAQFSDVSSAVNNPNLRNLFSTDQLSRVLGKNLSDLGLTFKDLAAIAHELGIEIDQNRIQFSDVAQIQKALRDSELGKFADTFAGQLAKMEAEAKLFDITDPIAQFNALRNALKGVKDGAGILGETLDQFDLTSPEGVADAIKSLQDLFTAITAGQIDPTRFGGLTGQELIDAILRAQDLLKGQAAAGTGGFNVDRSITEVTGSRIGGLLTSGNTFLSNIDTNVAAIAARILGSALSVPPITAPAISPSLGLGGASFNFAPGAFQVMISAPVTAQQAADLGAAAWDGFIERIDKSLGEQYRFQKRIAGDITTVN